MGRGGEETVSPGQIEWGLEQITDLRAEAEQELEGFRAVRIFEDFAVAEGRCLSSPGDYLVPVSLTDENMPAAMAEYLRSLVQEQGLSGLGSGEYSLTNLLTPGALRLHTRSKAAQTGLEVVDVVFRDGQFWARMRLHTEVKYLLRVGDKIGNFYSLAGGERLTGENLIGFVDREILVNSNHGEEICFLDRQGRQIERTEHAQALGLRVGGQVWQVGNGVSEWAINALGPDATGSAGVRKYFLEQRVHVPLDDPTKLQPNSEGNYFLIAETAAWVHIPDDTHLHLDQVVLIDLHSGRRQPYPVIHIKSHLIHGPGTNGWHIRLEITSPAPEVLQAIASGNLWVKATVHRDGGGAIPN